MDTILSIIKYFIYGFGGLIAFLFVYGILFGKRVRTQWEFEADFRDARGREFGEFEIELSKIEKEEPDFTLKAKFKMRHQALVPHAVVQVYVEDLLVLEETVETEGRMYLRPAHLINAVDTVSEGQTCRVVVGGTEIASAEFHPD